MSKYCGETMLKFRQSILVLLICFPSCIYAQSNVYKACSGSIYAEICIQNGEEDYAGHRAVNSRVGENFYQAYFYPSLIYSSIKWLENKRIASLHVDRSGFVGRNLGAGEYFPNNKNHNNVFPYLGSEFKASPAWWRRVIQKNLKRLELYNSSVDGLWGVNTYKAILAYQIIFNRQIDVSTKGAAISLLDKIYRHKRFDYKDGLIRTSSPSPSSMKDVNVCFLATTGNPKRWVQGLTGRTYAEEAKRRGLSCGVVNNSAVNRVEKVTKDSNKSTTFSTDPNKCGAVELCQRGSKTESGNRVWRTDKLGKLYAGAAQGIGLTCNVLAEQDLETSRVANGTGFFVTTDGHVVTNHHVIDGCTEVQVHLGGQVASATLVSQDRINDLALLKTKMKSINALHLASENPYLLQDIIAAGFPFGESVSSTIKVTRGVVSSLSGLGDNSGQIQIDAALQPGNSGGPIFDENGNVVGVAVAKLDLEKSIEAFGVVPENVNFGIKLSNLKTFLNDNNVGYKIGREREIKNSDLGKLAVETTALLSCWMTDARIEMMQNQKAMFKEVLK
jgi:S1-C subfamily serine protease